MPYLLTIEKEDDSNRFENILTEDTPVEWFKKNPDVILVSSWGLTYEGYGQLLRAVKEKKKGKKADGRRKRS